MGLLENLNTLITEHGSASIVKERLVLLREQLEHLQKEYDRLERENQRLKTENDKLREQLETQTVPDEYTENRGVLFRRLPNGNIQDEAYCPTCKIPMVSVGLMLPFHCSKCDFRASFTGRDLKRIVAEIA